MKNSVIKTTLLTSALVFCFFSCKKSSTTNSNTNNTSPPSVTYSTKGITIALVDASYNGYPGTYTSTRKAIMRCNGVKLDSLLGLDTTRTSTGLYSPCNSPSTTHSNYKAFKIQDGAENYLDIYDSNTVICSYHVWLTAQTPYLQPVTGSNSPGTNGALTCSPNPWLAQVFR